MNRPCDWSPTTPPSTSTGRCQIQPWSYREAIADYEQALRLEPDRVIAYVSRGAARDALGQYEEAFADFEQALQLRPDDASIYISRGKVKLDLGQYEDAFVDYDQAPASAARQRLYLLFPGQCQGPNLAKTGRRSSILIRPCACSPTSLAPISTGAMPGSN